MILGVQGWHGSMTECDEKGEEMNMEPTNCVCTVLGS